MTIEAAQVPQIAASAVRKAKVSFAGRLDSGEVLNGTPIVAELTTSDLTLGSPTLNGSAITVNGQSVAANEAVLFTFQGQSAGTTYEIRVSCTTDGGQTLVGIIKFTAVDDGT